MPSYVRDIRDLVGSRPLLLAAAGVVVLDEEHRILLQLRDDGSWGIPGGAMELGETFEQTARRELFEETGLSVDRLVPLDVYSGRDFHLRYPNGDEAYVVGVTFLASGVTGVPRPDGLEGIRLDYHPLHALPAGLNDFNRTLLRRCSAQLPG